MTEYTFWRMPQVEAATGYSRPTIYRLMENDGFPTPIPIGPRARAWISTEVRAWMDRKVAAARPQQHAVAA